MLTKAHLKGYLLEEALAWLLRNSGYRLLSRTGDDRAELTTSQDGSLAVRGRGARHQVDVLGQFAFTPAFSLPVRMFLEAKSYNERCGLSIVRNAHGVIHDINQNFAIPELREPASSNHGSARPRRRYHYVYTLFSTSGFTTDAQRFALAHQISLVDLSGDSFKWLRDRIGTAADLLYTASTQNGITKFPVNWLRAVLRNELKTADISEPSDISTNAPQFRATALPVVQNFVGKLTERLNTELLLGFPEAPFVIPFVTADAPQFLQHADAQPTHHVRLWRTGHNSDAEWNITAVGGDPGYHLTFKLAREIEEWISEVEDDERARTISVKRDFFPSITIYRARPTGGVDTYQLRYTWEGRRSVE
ncbi:hypothetical protein [Streptomyces sp. LS1784]|uniref:hypothetical protein n=1 Tax=Streptomyces sp. LS1784 TaxID=2851533 RepID=UPI001CCEE6FE|nr:hypothetical protein [Streptomyces sp. LS1784]